MIKTIPEKKYHLLLDENMLLSFALDVYLFKVHSPTPILEYIAWNSNYTTQFEKEHRERFGKIFETTATGSNLYLFIFICFCSVLNINSLWISGCYISMMHKCFVILFYLYANTCIFKLNIQMCFSPIAIDASRLQSFFKNSHISIPIWKVQN